MADHAELIAAAEHELRVVGAGASIRVPASDLLAILRDQPTGVKVPCERCQGNGEIVTDWERYRHPREGDVGDEAVAECPDCDGEGEVSALEPAALSKQEAVAYRVHDFHVARQPVKAKGKFPEPTEFLYPASREQDAKDTARIMGGTCTPLYASPVPAEPSAHLCGLPEFGTYAGQVILVPPPWLREKWPTGIGIDVCLALEMQDLWRAGIRTTGHCCGHGRAQAFISVDADGVELMRARGYETYPHPDGRDDHFVPKTRFVRTAGPSAEGWRPMSSVPRKGHVILDLGQALPGVTDARVGGWISEAQAREMGEDLSASGGWIIWSSGSDWFVIPFADAQGWMPLPPAPHGEGA